MKVEGIYDCEGDYDSDQAEAKDVPDIVARYARAGAFGVLLVGAGPPIGFFILGRQLVWHELLLPVKVITAFPATLSRFRELNLVLEAAE